MAQTRSLHRHHAGRLPGRPAAGQPRLPGQRAPRRQLGVAGALPAQRDPDRRRHHHPAQGRGVPRVRGAQGRGQHREEPPDRGPAHRLAQHPARVLPARHRDRGLRGHGHLRPVVPGERGARRPRHQPHRDDDRLRARHRRDDRLGRSHRPRRAPAGLPLRHHRDAAVGHPAVPAAQHRHRGRGRPRLRRQLRDLPELPRRRPGGLVLRAVRRPHPHHRRLAGLPALRRGLRLHAPHRHRPVRRLRLDRPGPAHQRLRPARRRRDAAHPRDLGAQRARRGGGTRAVPGPSVPGPGRGPSTSPPSPPPPAADGPSLRGGPP